MADEIDTDAEMQRLKNLASSPSITGLPGLAFALDQDGKILSMNNADVLNILVNDPDSTSSDDRLLAGLRLGVWFQHAVKVSINNPKMKRTEPPIYVMIQDSVRSRHKAFATQPRYNAKKLMAMFLAFEQARIRFMKDEKSTNAPTANTPTVKHELSETTFLEPIDTWIRCFDASKNGRADALKFIAKTNWTVTISTEYQKRFGRNFHVVPERDLAVLSAAALKSRKRSRTDDNADDAGDAVVTASGLAQDIQSMYQKALQLDRLLGTKKAQNDELIKEMTNLQINHFITMGRFQQDLDDAKAKHEDALSQIDELQKRMEKMNIEAEASGLSDDDVKRRLKRVCEKWEAAKTELAEAKTRNASREVELWEIKSAVNSHEERLREALKHLQTFKGVADAAKDEARAAQEEVCAAKDKAREAEEKAHSDRTLFLRFRTLLEDQNDRLKKDLAAEKAEARKLRDTIAKLGKTEKPKAE